MESNRTVSVVEISSIDRKREGSSKIPSLSYNVTMSADTNGHESARLKCKEESQMGNLIHFPEAESADCVPSAEPIDSGRIRASTAMLSHVCTPSSRLSPRTAHQLMRKIVGVYRNLATIAEGELE
jgi:hypothetical protein